MTDVITLSIQRCVTDQDYSTSSTDVTGKHGRRDSGNSQSPRGYCFNQKLICDCVSTEQYQLELRSTIVLLS
jgi:hypothetical protein